MVEILQMLEDFKCMFDHHGVKNVQIESSFWPVFYLSLEVFCKKGFLIKLANLQENICAIEKDSGTALFL